MEKVTLYLSLKINNLRLSHRPIISGGASSATILQDQENEPKETQHLAPLGSNVQAKGSEAMDLEKTLAWSASPLATLVMFLTTLSLPIRRKT